LIKSKKLLIRIFIYFYKKNPIFKNLKLFSTPSRTFFISHRALLLMHNRTGDSFLILSNELGLVTHLDALRRGIGGKILMRASL
jgi:ribosomal protein S8